MPKTNAAEMLTGYAPVAERVRLFYERYPEGRIVTHLRRRTADEVIFEAVVFRGATDVLPAATGWACEREGDGEINLVACLENTETSAIGRALANLGFTASAQRPSAEEMEKATRARARVAQQGDSAAVARRTVDTANDARGARATSRVAETRVEDAGAADLLRADLLSLVRRCAMRGLVRPGRATRWIAALEARRLDSAQLFRWERRLRAWARAAERPR